MDKSKPKCTGKKDHKKSGLTKVVDITTEREHRRQNDHGGATEAMMDFNRRLAALIRTAAGELGPDEMAGIITYAARDLVAIHDVAMASNPHKVTEEGRLSGEDLTRLMVGILTSRSRLIDTVGPGYYGHGDQAKGEIRPQGDETE